MFQGAMTALVTPMKGGQVDEGALEALVESQIAAGIDVLVPCATTGESATLNADERARVISIVVRASKPRVPVLAGTGSNSTADAIAHSQAARNAGASG